MKILILEDDENRIIKFKYHFIGAEFFITDNPKVANKWISEEEFGLILLDHDLMDEHYLRDCDSKETTGLCTAEYLGNNPNTCKNATIIVHSLNPTGSERMMSALNGRNKHRVPFTEIFHRLIVDKSI